MREVGCIFEAGASRKSYGVKVTDGNHSSKLTSAHDLAEKHGLESDRDMR